MKCFHRPAFMSLFNLKVKQTKSDKKKKIHSLTDSWSIFLWSTYWLINRSLRLCRFQSVGRHRASLLSGRFSTSGVDRTLNVHRQTLEFRFRSSRCSERMYNHTSNQQLICPINTQSHWEPAGEVRRGRGQSLLLGVFITKINVSSGIKIDDNLYLS